MNEIDQSLKELIETGGEPKVHSLVKYISDDTVKDIALRIATMLPKFKLDDAFLALRENADEESALLNIARTPEENETCVKAQRSHAALVRTAKKWRETLKRPFIDAGRDVDALFNEVIEHHDKEAARIGLVCIEFKKADDARIREEQRVQQLRLDEIARKERDEIERIAREQREKEQLAIQARQAAERATAEAKSKAERESARLAREQSDRLAREANESAARANAAVEKVQETAAKATLIESKPIAPERAAGQVFADDWDIVVVSPYEAIKHYPDCFREPEPLLGAIKARIKAGLAFDKNYTMSGIRFDRKLKANVRTGKVIEI